jgi:epoxyqueuosine reductase
LIEVFSWSQNHFENLMKGSAIHRIGYAQWMRNVAVGLGNLIRNSNTSAQVQLKAKEVLRFQYKKINDLVDEHIQWALNE